MVSMEQINGEIAMLEEEKPTHAVMQKLASLYTVRDHMMIGFTPVTPIVTGGTIEASGEKLSEFMQLVSGMNANEVMPVIDELMDVLQATNQRLYNGVLRKIMSGV